MVYVTQCVAFKEQLGYSMKANKNPISTQGWNGIIIYIDILYKNKREKNQLFLFKHINITEYVFATGQGG